MSRQLPSVSIIRPHLARVGRSHILSLPGIIPTEAVVNLSMQLPHTTNSRQAVLQHIQPPRYRVTYHRNTILILRHENQPSQTLPQHRPRVLLRPVGDHMVPSEWHHHIILIGIQFKHSPFFRIDRAVSNIVECPGARQHFLRNFAGS